MFMGRTPPDAAAFFFLEAFIVLVVIELPFLVSERLNLFAVPGESISVRYGLI